MKAIRIHEFGDPNTLNYEEISRPYPNAGEVLVEVHAAGVNPVDWKARQGLSLRDEIQFPYILGWDVSGVVRESNSPDFKIGDEVYGMVSFPQEGGAYAEYVTASAAHLAHKPASLSHIQAAAVPLAALTAWQAFEAAQLTPNQRVLIHAAAGGVGHFAVQFAKLRGAYVIATASAQNADFVKQLGADEVIDHRSIAFEDAVKEVDLVLEAIGGENATRSLKTIKDGGKMVLIVGRTQVEPERAIEIIRMTVYPSREHLTQLAQLFDAGKLQVTVSHTFALQEAAYAHEQLESKRTRGKVVLRVAG